MRAVRACLVGQAVWVGGLMDKATLDALQALAQAEADRGDGRALAVVLRLRRVLEAGE